MTASASGSRERMRSAVTIGTFDGVHVGHQLLVSTTRRLADEQGLRDVVVTFDRHPFATVRPAATPKLLTTQEQKIELLRSLGADDVVVLEFDVARSHQEPESFIEDFLVGELQVAVVVVGAAFRFGHRARGDAAMLQQMGKKLGFSVVTLDLVGDETGGIVSSSHIRELITEGRLDDAAHLLGRPFEVRGALVAGDANRVVIPRELLVPPAGTYAVELLIADRTVEATATVVAQAADEDAIIDVIVESGSPPAAGLAALRFLGSAVHPSIGANSDG
jgi:riboflavin kinase/FMN adenylyltransferase